MKSRRSSGILLHPTALPGPYGLGDLGETAHRFVDFLAGAGQSVWQVLPLGPPGHGDSPYSAFSAFAGNPLLISPEQLVASGDLPPQALDGTSRPEGVADYGFAAAFKQELLRVAAHRFRETADPARQSAFAAFCASEAGWLEDYVLFQALRAAHHQRHWHDWPPALRDREPAALAAAATALSATLHCERYSQFVFHEQWSAVRRHAAACGVRLFGDLPIFVADDSADVWAHRRLFRLDAAGRPLQVAGVPPDYFSSTGQRWGNPLYNWNAMVADGFAWWIARLQRNLELYDLVRIDHFRGFDACWAIPADEPTAIHGAWEATPGEALFTAATAALGRLPVVAEDLGIITPPVEALRDHFGFPGMKILQFAFGDDSANPYLPHNYIRNCVVYTGTHDNDTTLGWWEHLAPVQRAAVARYLGHEPAPARALIRLALSSVADLCIFPLQDVLELGSSARFNTPGAPHGNWRWRLTPEISLDSAKEWLAELSRIYGRFHQ